LDSVSATPVEVSESLAELKASVSELPVRATGSALV
jgi:hypothetical protein